MGSPAWTSLLQGKLNHLAQAIGSTLLMQSCEKAADHGSLNLLLGRGTSTELTHMADNGDTASLQFGLSPAWPSHESNDSSLRVAPHGPNVVSPRPSPNPSRSSTIAWTKGSRSCRGGARNGLRNTIQFRHRLRSESGQELRWHNRHPLWCKSTTSPKIGKAIIKRALTPLFHPGHLNLTPTILLAPFSAVSAESRLDSYFLLSSLLRQKHDLGQAHQN